MIVFTGVLFQHLEVVAVIFADPDSMYICIHDKKHHSWIQICSFKKISCLDGRFLLGECPDMLYVITLEVQPPFFISWFKNHQEFG